MILHWRATGFFACAIAYLVSIHSVAAIYESQAGAFDWHHAWIGKPRSWARDDTHLIVVTERNVLASLQISTGALGLLTVSGDAVHVRAWDKATGKLVWDRELGVVGQYSNVQALTFENGDSAVMGAHKLTRLSSEGQVLWTWEHPDRSASILDIRLIDDVIYVVDQPRDKTLQVTPVQGASGTPLKATRVTCRSEADQVILAGRFTAWVEKGTVKWNALGTKQVNSISFKNLGGLLPSFKTASQETLRLVPLTEQPNSDTLFITASTGSEEGEEEEEEEEKSSLVVAQFRFSEEGKHLVLSLDLGMQPTFGAVDPTETVMAHFMQLSPSEMLVRITSHDGSAKHRQHTLQHDFTLSGDVAAAKVISHDPFSAVITTLSGSVYAYNDSAIVWSREEALAHTTAAEFLDLPEEQMWTQMEDELSESIDEQHSVSPLTRYKRRLIAHAAELRQLPAWILNHAVEMGAPVLKKKGHAVSLLASQSAWTDSTSKPERIYRDNFGLRKFIISVTDTGKVIAQDSERRGTIVWSRYLGDLHLDHVYVVRAASVKLPPVIVVIGRSERDETTYFHRLNALTGQDYESTIPEATQYFEPQLSTEIRMDKIMRLPIEEPEERTHILAIYEAGSSRIYIYPDTSASRAAFQQFAPSFYFSHQTRSGSFKGFRIAEGYRGSLTAQPVWDLVLPKDETLAAVGQRQPYEKIASLGRVLGNRNVLYKYLNPHMFAILTANEQQQTLSVRLVDGVKGTILYESVHHHVDATHHPVRVVQAEHWIVYHFWSTDSTTKGYQVVVLELFEGAHENERVVSTNFSSFDNILPHARSAAFAFPYAVQTIGVTTTRQGVSTRDILFSLPTHQIMSVNKRLLDPRRPTDKPSKEDQEEQLMPYAPIADERRAFLTYSLQVAGIRHIIASPALLESTSLVFAYGLDTFFTRSTPSRQFDVLSEDFSKSQLLLTIVGLVVGIMIAGPMVRRKRVNAMWQ